MSLNPNEQNPTEGMIRPVSPETQGLINKHIQGLGLKWRVRTAVIDGLDRPSIVSDAAMHEHRIGFPVRFNNTEDEFDVVHELIHGRFAERMDPIFSAVLFLKDTYLSNPETARKARQVYYAQQLVDVWVADYMQAYDPVLVDAETHSYIGYANGLLDLGILNVQDIVNSADFIIASALNYAEIKRVHLRKMEKPQSVLRRRLSQILTGDSEKVSMELGTYYRDLPILPPSTEDAVRLFSDKSREAARILGFDDVEPQIVTEDAKHVWKF